MSEAGRHVERKIGDAIPDFQILGVQDIGRIEVGGEFRAELREGRARVVPSAFDLDRRNVPTPPDFRVGNQEVDLHAVRRARHVFLGVA